MIALILGGVLFVSSHQPSCDFSRISYLLHRVEISDYHPGAKDIPLSEKALDYRLLSAITTECADSPKHYLPNRNDDLIQAAGFATQSADYYFDLSERRSACTMVAQGLSLFARTHPSNDTVNSEYKDNFVYGALRSYQKRCTVR